MKNVKKLVLTALFVTTAFVTLGHAEFIATSLGSNDSIVATIIKPLDNGYALRYGLGNIVVPKDSTTDLSYTLSAGVEIPGGLDIDLGYAKSSTKGGDPTISLTFIKGYTYKVAENLQLGVAIVLGSISSTGGSSTIKLLQGTLPVIVANFTF